MKILWLCNMAPGAIREVIGRENRGALWMDHVFHDLKKMNFSVRVLFADQNTVNGELDALRSYASYAEGKAHVYTAKLENVFLKELLAYHPDVVHIWGTEYGHSLAMVNAAEKAGCLDKVVISIQGMCSVIARHYSEGIPAAVQRSNTFRDLVMRNNLQQQQRRFWLRGEMEVKALKKVHHVIGRTDWDKACTTQINPQVQYHFCNETLRQEFYDGQWSYVDCKKHQIFASGCDYPVKGFHYLLEAAGQIVKSYPDMEIVVAGLNPFPRKGWQEKLRMSVYAGYMTKLIRKNGLEGKVRVAGFLDADRMRQEYLQANVFVMPSTIENSPNSLGEAMVLGVPCVAGNVGGIADMMSHKKEGFVYQSTAPYMLAYYIMKVFAMGDRAEALGEAARERAAKTHSPEENLKHLVEIYHRICGGQ